MESEKQIVLIAHNLRSCHNVGSLLRTADGLGITKVYLTGYTPYPLHTGDTRLPHLATKIDKQIHKTALGAEKTVAWESFHDVFAVFTVLKDQGYRIAAIEQAEHSTPLPDYRTDEPIALVVGREVEGMELEVLAACDVALEIPMFGQKESFNVVQAAAMAMFHFRFL
jgi:tRNA G18 (ribose-2'-O)-methylase SpoU